MRKHRIVLATVLVLTTMSAPVWAQSSRARQAVTEARENVAVGRFAEALQLFADAVAYSPGDGAIHCEYGWIAYRSRDFALAERQVDEGLALLASGFSLGIITIWFANHRLTSATTWESPG